MKSALFATFNHTGIENVAKCLVAAGITVYAFGSSYAILSNAGIPSNQILNDDELVQFVSQKSLKFVIANLPNPASLTDLSTEIHAVISSAAAAFKKIATYVRSEDYSALVESIQTNQPVSLNMRRSLAGKCLKHTAAYDISLSEEISNASDRSCSNIKDQNVLLIGGGGREHAIAWKLQQSQSVANIHVAPGNGGTASIGCMNVQLDVTNHKLVVEFCREHDIHLVVVGPEIPLVAGLADSLRSSEILCFGPSSKAAQIEGSKAFSKELMQKYNIPTAKFKIFTNYDDAKAHVESINYRVVVKASGLAAGKGVLLPETQEETIQALKEMFLDKTFGSACNEVVLEEFMEGEEVSLLCFSDGNSIVPMIPAQDHKRALDGDLGLNTGGMGAYAPAPVLTPALLKQTVCNVLRPTLNAMHTEGIPYVGCLYAGLMVTPANEVKVVEFNCRFGDPETQVVLPLLKSDLYEIFRACCECRLDEVDIEWKTGACATVVAVSGGYPEKYEKHKVITGLTQATRSALNVQIFHAGTQQEQYQSDDNNNNNNNSIGDDESDVVEAPVVKTSGGRVLNVTATSATLRGAVSQCYKAMSCVQFDGMHYRRDIGHKALNRPLRVGVMGSTRGTDLQYIIDAISNGELSAKVELVVSNRKNAYILQRSADHNIPSLFVSGKGKSRETFDNEVSKLFVDVGVDVICLIGYMKIISDSFVDEWWGKLINVHPSLLPKYGGGMDVSVHEAVLRAGDSKSGCTLHFVTHEVDAGPMIAQLECEVDLQAETVDSLKKKVQQLEGEAFVQAIREFQTGILPQRLHEELISHATKKTPATSLSSTTTTVSSNRVTGVVTYADAGVSIDNGNALVNAIKPICATTKRPGCDADLGGFGGAFDLAAAGYGNKDTVLIACNDGVGTKLKVAIAAGKHDTVGIDLVAMCVNDLIVQGAEPLLFLDYYATGSLSVEIATEVVKGIAQGCVESGAGLIGGETAEMPSMYAPGEYDLAGFSVGAVHRNHILPKQLVVGDVVLGLSSSGLHSNGFSLVRKLINLHKLDYSDVAPFNPSQSLADALLIPTRIYVKSLLPCIKSNEIKALAHITGGGLVENIPRVLDNSKAVRISRDSWEIPSVFNWLSSLGNIPSNELLRTFNCGIGMVLIVSKELVSTVQTALTASGETVFEIGSVVERPSLDSEQVIFI